MKAEILIGDCLERMRELPPGIAQTCITSPPYFGLRDYGVDGQIGLEPTPEEFVSKMVDVFREVRRVLRDDGTLWLNLGDSYNAYNGNRGASTGCANKNHHEIMPSLPGGAGLTVKGLKSKDLIGIPWRVAFALQSDGWYLRQDIIWHKPNPMPESVRDRCTKAHEYLFLLAKSDRYYFDAEAFREPQVKGAAGSEFCAGKTREHQLGRASTKPRKVPAGWDTEDGAHGSIHRKGRSVRPGVDTKGGGQGSGEMTWPNETRNRRTVWTIPTHPFSGAHFATFPPALVEPCVLAGCPIGGTVLDPFSGAGTTGFVALRSQRNYIGCELNPAYAAMSEARIREDAPMLNDVAVTHPCCGQL